MARENCSKCGNPREADSSSASYCKACTRAYQRTRYRDRRIAAGLQVKPRVANSDNRDSTTAEREKEFHDIYRAVLINKDPTYCAICAKDLADETAYPFYKRLGSYAGPRTEIAKPERILMIACHTCISIAETIYSWGLVETGRILQVCISNTFYPEQQEVHTNQAIQTTPPRENVKVLEFDSGEKYEWEMLGPPKAEEPKEMIEWDHGRFIARYKRGEPSVEIPDEFDADEADAYTKAAYQGITIHDERSPLRKKREREEAERQER